MTTDSVTKSDGWDVYHVRASHEWATIAVKGWQAIDVDQRPREIGEILIHSSYGSWAYRWSHLGKPFKGWLAEADDPSYIAGKFLGSEAYVFDGEKTVRQLRQSLLEHRKTGDITKGDARAIWDWIEYNEYDLESSSDRFVERMRDCEDEADWPTQSGRFKDATPERGARYFLQEPWERIATSLDRSFVRFWEVLMPVFQQALRDEIESTTEAA
ncbi:hypothetical protein [Macromonas nakdongensis]|uniref:hypothetical protein n=1 Tax=Macromonas nakdongensis TaxID=1843082 RepID=UPI000C34574E|nr:hypothetical protein [Macromonas nakdongensis]